MSVWYVGGHWIYMAQDRTYLRVVVKNVTYSKRDRKYLDHLVTSSYARRISVDLFSCFLNFFAN